MTQEEILEHLCRGGTVENQYGTKVYLDKFGCQVIVNTHNPKSKKVFYRFDNPEYWHITK
jgi:hypothetical protein